MELLQQVLSIFGLLLGLFISIGFLGEYEVSLQLLKDTKNLLEQLISGIFQAVYVLTG